MNCLAKVLPRIKSEPPPHREVLDENPRYPKKISGIFLCRYNFRLSEKRIIIAVVREALIKSKSTRSNEHTHGSDFDTLRFNQRVLNYDKHLDNPAFL